MDALVKNINPLNLTKLSAVVLISLSLINCSSPTKYPLRDSQTYSGPDPVESPSKSKSSSLVSSNLCGKIYRVKNGDSLSEIAHKCDISMSLLAKTNGIFSPYVIYKNQEIIIPDQVSSYDAAEIVAKPSIKSSLQKLKASESSTEKTLGKTRENIKIKPATAVNPTTNSAVKTTSWQWPVHQGAPHRFIRDNAGLSIVEVYGLSGQEIYAVAPGKVVYSGDGIVNFGLMVVVKHDDEYMSIYAHNSALLVKEGQRVKAGQQIAVLGATGNTSRPKLYLEARYQGRKIDILKVLAKPKPS